MPRTATKTGDAVSEYPGHRLPGAGTLDLRPTGDPAGSVDLNLTGLLSRLLAQGDEKGTTWAQRLIEGWIVTGLEGDHRATLDILDRTEKVYPSRASAADAPLTIDEQATGKILEILCGDGEGPTSD